MVIVSQNKTHIYNFDTVKEIYATPSNSDLSIRIILSNDSKGYEVGRYDTNSDRMTAIQMIYEKMSSYNLIFVPTVEDVRTYLSRTHNSVQRAENGRKTVRRGGS